MWIHFEKWRADLETPESRLVPLCTLFYFLLATPGRNAALL